MTVDEALARLVDREQLTHPHDDMFDVVDAVTELYMLCEHFGIARVQMWVAYMGSLQQAEQLKACADDPRRI